MRNGITPVVAIVLLLMMTVAASGGAYAWMQQVQDTAQEDASQGLSTSLSVKSVACGSGVVEVAVSNTGSTAVDVSAADLYVRSDGTLESGRTDIPTGKTTLQPGGFDRFRFLADAVAEPGRDLSVELGFPNDDVTVSGTCSGVSTIQNTTGAWRMEKRTGVTRGIDTGYLSDELTFQADMWDGSSNNGEFSISCSTCTLFDNRGWHNVTPLNWGIACQDSASGTGYIMYSNESVHTRFSGNPHNDNADHFICTTYDDGWRYDTNNEYLDFTPRDTDTLVATADFDADTVTDLSSGIIDDAGSDNPATVIGDPQWVNGTAGTTLAFDGTDDHLLAAETSALDITDEITISAWINWSGGGGTWQGIVSKGNAQPYALTLNNNGFIHFEWARSGCGSDYETSPGTVTADTWHHVAATYDGSTVRLYVDGELEREVSLSGCTTTTTDQRLRIGQGNDGEYFAGRIDDVQVISEAIG